MKQEYSIWKTLNTISSQRVERLLDPGGIQVISGSPAADEKQLRNIQTCLMRGWIEPLDNAIPIEFAPDDEQSESQQSEDTPQLYRLTESGWTSIYRSYLITTLAVIALVIVFF
jgi:hypothetical protein